jgi:hypothetical protein
MEDAPPHAPEPTLQTLITEHGKQLARLHVPLWPHRGAVIELEPPHSALVTDVRLRLSPGLALILISVESASVKPDLAET